MRHRTLSVNLAASVLPTGAAVVLAVMLLASPAMSADCGFGCFVDRWQLAHPDKWEAYCKHMVSIGMNTMAFYPKSDADLIDQVETALRVGMLQPDVPIILVSNMPRRAGVAATNEAEWADLPARVKEARESAAHGDQWPPVFLYGTDEPVKGEQCKEWSASYRKAGAKGLTSICYPNIPDFLPYLDGVLIHASPGVLTADNVAATRKAGVLFGVYNIGLSRKSTPELARYWTGMWTWQTGCSLNLLWWYPDLIDDTGPEPVGKPICKGYAEGVRDYRLLRKLDALRDKPDLDFWPGITGNQGPEVAAQWKADWIAYTAKCKVPNPFADALAERGAAQ